jgi:hypothetical protein
VWRQEELVELNRGKDKRSIVVALLIYPNQFQTFENLMLLSLDSSPEGPE